MHAPQWMHLSGYDVDPVLFQAKRALFASGDAHPATDAFLGLDHRPAHLLHPFPDGVLVTALGDERAFVEDRHAVDRAPSLLLVDGDLADHVQQVRGPQQVELPRERPFDAEPEHAGREAVLHPQRQQSRGGLLQLFPLPLGDDYPGTRQLFLDRGGDALPAPQAQFHPFLRLADRFGILVQVGVPFLGTARLLLDQLQLRQVRGWAEEASDAVQAMLVPGVERRLAHEDVYPDVERRPMLYGRGADLSRRPRVPPDAGLVSPLFGFVFPLADERQNAVREMFHDRLHGRTELVRLAAPAEIPSGGPK